MLHCTRVLLLLAVVSIHLCLFQPFDDAYIHLRIARNLVEDGAPYFNAGQANMASSSPVWTVVLAGALLLFGDNLVAISCLNALITFSAALLWGKLCRALSGGERIWEIAGALLCLGGLLNSSVGLMETPLAVLLLAAALLLYLNRQSGAIALLALGPFVRPELAVFFGIFTVSAIASRRYSFLRVAVESLLGGLPFVIYGITFFGTIIPQTMLAKSRVYKLAGSEFVHLILRSFFGDDIVSGKKTPLVFYIVATIGSALWLVFSRSTPKTAKDREALRPASSLAMGGAAVLMAYFLKRAMLFPWYIPLFTLPIATGAAVIAEKRRIVPLTCLAGLLALPLLVMLAGMLSAVLDESRYPEIASAARVRSYLEIGTELSSRFPRARLLTSEIGALGWSFEGEIVDAAGIATPSALAYHPLKIPDQRPSGMLSVIPLELVKDAEPELIVSMDVFLRDFEKTPISGEYVRETRPVFLEEDRAKIGRSQLWHSASLNIWIRRDLLPARNVPDGSPL